MCNAATTPLCESVVRAVRSSSNGSRAMSTNSDAMSGSGSTAVMQLDRSPAGLNAWSGQPPAMPGSGSTDVMQTTPDMRKAQAALDFSRALNIWSGNPPPSYRSGSPNAGDDRGQQQRKRKNKCVPRGTDCKRNAPAPASVPEAHRDASMASASSDAAVARPDDDAFDPSRPRTSDEKSQLTPVQMLTWTIYHLLEAGKLNAAGCPGTGTIVRKLTNGLHLMQESFTPHDLAYANGVAQRTLARNYPLSTSAVLCGSKTVVLSPSDRWTVGEFLRGAGLGCIAEDMRM